MPAAPAAPPTPVQAPAMAPAPAPVVPAAPLPTSSVVSTEVGITADPAVLPARAVPVPNFPDNATQSLGDQRAPGMPGQLNYIPVVSAVPNDAAPSGIASPASPAPAATGVSAAPAPRERRAALGTAGIAVPSADGPLDVYVIDGGVRLSVDPTRP